MYVFGGTVDNNVRSGEMYRFQVNRQGSHRLEKYLNLEGFLEKSLKI